MCAAFVACGFPALRCCVVVVTAAVPCVSALLCVPAGDLNSGVFFRVAILIEANVQRSPFVSHYKSDVQLFNRIIFSGISSRTTFSQFLEGKEQNIKDSILFESGLGTP